MAGGHGVLAGAHRAHVVRERTKKCVNIPTDDDGGNDHNTTSEVGGRVRKSGAQKCPARSMLLASVVAAETETLVCVYIYTIYTIVGSFRDSFHNQRQRDRYTNTQHQVAAMQAREPIELRFICRARRTLLRANTLLRFVVWWKRRGVGEVVAMTSVMGAADTLIRNVHYCKIK